jgi:hypothetical protein
MASIDPADLQGARQMLLERMRDKNISLAEALEQLKAEKAGRQNPMIFDFAMEGLKQEGYR